MFCKQCRKQWTIKTDNEDEVRFCPFCGKSLDKDKNYDLQKPNHVLAYIAYNYGIDTLKEQRLIGMFLDLAPLLRDESHLISIAIECGTYASIIKTHQTSESEINHCVKKEIETLKTKRFLDAQYARKVIAWLLYALGIEMETEQTAQPKQSPLREITPVTYRPIIASTSQQTVSPSLPNSYIASSSKFFISNNVLMSYRHTDKTAKVPDGVTTIGESAFAGNTHIKTVYLPDSVVNILPRAFQNCSNLETVHFSKNLRDIRSNAFQGCTKLKTVTLPPGVNIAMGAFPYGVLISHTIKTDSAFHPNSGPISTTVNQSLLIPIPVREGIFECPNCHTSQRDNRLICFQCGRKFDLSEYQKLLQK